MFTWYELRTTDLDAAARFYAEVMEWQVQQTAAGETLVFVSAKGGTLMGKAGTPMGGLSLLPEPAVRRGAPPHWLGYVAVPDVAAMAARFVAAGGQRLSPSLGGDVAVIRDPQGAVLGLCSGTDRKSHAVAWHEHYAPDSEKAFATYAELLSFRTMGMLDLGPGVGSYRTISWGGLEGSIGGMLSTARTPHIHPQWLFYLTVDSLDRALSRVRALDGLIAQEPLLSPSGARFAVCDDPQGAAFALRELPRSSP